LRQKKNELNLTQPIDIICTVWIHPLLFLTQRLMGCVKNLKPLFSLTNFLQKTF